jgi:hypothetical protein
MKYIIFILALLILLLCGCSQPILQADTIPETITVTSIVTETIEVEDTAKIEELELELQQYKSLIANLNDLLKNIYYGYAENDKYILDGFTAFSIEYKGKYYLITAGHCVENENGKFGNFKFKANFSNEWIYPELLDYGNGNDSSDYAIFYSDKINNGLNFGTDINNLFILGAGKLNVVKLEEQNSMSGESGSPIINLNGEVVYINCGLYNTPIGTVLQAIDNLK